MLVNPRRRRLRMTAVLLLAAGLVAGAFGIYLWLSVQLAYATSHGSAWTSPTAEHLQSDLDLAGKLFLGAGVLLAGGILAAIASRSNFAGPRGT